MRYMKAMAILLLISGSCLAITQEKLLSDRTPEFRFQSGLMKSTLAILHGDSMDVYEIEKLKGACLSYSKRTFHLRDSGQTLRGMFIVGPNYAYYTLNNCFIDTIRLKYMIAKPYTDSIDRLIDRIDRFGVESMKDESILLPPDAFQALFKSRFPSGVQQEPDPKGNQD